MNEVLEILESTNIPVNRNSKKTQGKNNLILHFGNICQPFHGYRECKANSDFPELFASLKRLIFEIDPEFQYSTITVNKNVQCIPHRDTSNHSETWIVGLGDFEGGELFVEDVGIVDIKGKPFKFDGFKFLHYNLPWTGTRYSVMFYNNKNSKNVN
jgi:hypothetical protein